MDVLSAIELRASAARLNEPGPAPDKLEQILHAGLHAPDHGRLSPWRFVVIEGDARKRFGQFLADRLRTKDPGASSDSLEKEAAKPLRAPTIVTVAAAITQGKIPEIEQVLAVGAGVQNMLLAAGALGFAAMWKTGEPAYDPAVKQFLGLDAGDHIVAFLYLGTAPALPPARNVSLEGLWHRI
jgi:nitroreductase